LWENGYPDDRSLGGSVALQYFLWKRYEPDDAVTVAMDADMRWGKFHAQGRPSKGREYMMNLAQTIISKGKGRIKPPYRTLKAMYGVKSVYELPKDVGRCN
ncbi:MAG: hypothetical protein HOC20_07000, partial [Chloroflexi bacterium]|nr:hypothetical protein [Chloroflexota bacterium]